MRGVAYHTASQASSSQVGLRPVWLQQSPLLRPTIFGSTRTLLTSTQRPRACRALKQVRAQSSSNGAQHNGAHEYDFDLFTIGAGSGGVRAARWAASNYGVKAAVCEMPFARKSSDVAGGAGGTCVLRGCVPKKLMVYGGEFAQAFKDSVGFGWDAEVPGITWQRLMENKNKELDRLNGVYRMLLDGAGVEYIEGRGKLVDAHTVEVGGKKYTAKNILIAVGGRATKLPIPGAEHAIISDDILDLPELPKKLAIVGGGYIALEFAGIYNNFGSETHVVYRQPLPLRGFDEEVRQFVAEQYEQHGLNLHPEASPTEIQKGADGKLTLISESKKHGKIVLEGLDHVLLATGRKPNTKNLGCEEAGVELDEKSGAVKVNEFSQTSVPSIYAVGDVTDRMNLTPVALMEGMAFAKHVFGDDAEAKPDYDFIPSAVFSSPPIANVGLSEEQAVEKYKNVDVFTSSYKPMKNTLSGNEGRGFMKILVASDTDTVVGVHLIGPETAEIIQGFAVAVKMGVSKKMMDTVVGVHPSSAEELVTMRTPSRQIRDKSLVPA
ncbi:g11564 [Coccomyxa viridis]|uniref:G11564 protein n=1 Tax=Coccomyxa viridis TaxID=1274662 RepID=A0ABP1GAT9_9CHLO